ncbi:MAG: YerC/YecD family TrpR-related protein [Candidatus Roizmanbacteria bacterium]
MSQLRKGQKSSFTQSQVYEARNEREKNFIKAFTTLSTTQEVANFLRDLMTLSEVQEFSNRLEIAKCLVEGKSYQSIAQEIETSTTTVTRVAQWLYSGCNGYFKVLKEEIDKQKKLK